MTALALELIALRKRYGRRVALDGLTFSVPRGVICGFIGPNGAGKTTTFGVVGGVLRLDAGRVDLLGDGPFSARKHRGRVTLLPQDARLPEAPPVRDLLCHLGRLQGLSAVEAERSADEVLEAVALADRASSRLKQLSHGMRRRVAVAQALLGDPELVLLDEPTSGLDPELVVRMRELFAAQRGKRTLIISSHNLKELEAVCDHLVFIDKGRSGRSGTLAEVTQRGTLMRYRVARTFELAEIQAALPDLHLCWAGEVLVVQAPQGWSAPRVNSVVLPALLQADVPLLEVHRGRSLEDAYLDGKV